MALYALRVHGTLTLPPFHYKTPLVFLIEPLSLYAKRDLSVDIHIAKLLSHVSIGGHHGSSWVARLHHVVDRVQVRSAQFGVHSAKMKCRPHNLKYIPHFNIVVSSPQREVPDGQCWLLLRPQNFTVIWIIFFCSLHLSKSTQGLRDEVLWMSMQTSLCGHKIQTTVYII